LDKDLDKLIAEFTSADRVAQRTKLAQRNSIIRVSPKVPSHAKVSSANPMQRQGKSNRALNQPPKVIKSYARKEPQRPASTDPVIRYANDPSYHKNTPIVSIDKSMSKPRVIVTIYNATHPEQHHKVTKILHRMCRHYNLPLLYTHKRMFHHLLGKIELAKSTQSTKRPTSSEFIETNYHDELLTILMHGDRDNDYSDHLTPRGRSLHLRAAHQWSSNHDSWYNLAKRTIYPIITVNVIDDLEPLDVDIPSNPYFEGHYQAQASAVATITQTTNITQNTSPTVVTPLTTAEPMDTTAPANTYIDLTDDIDDILEPPAGFAQPLMFEKGDDGELYEVTENRQTLDAVSAIYSQSSQPASSTQSGLQQVLQGLRSMDGTIQNVRSHLSNWAYSPRYLLQHQTRSSAGTSPNSTMTNQSVAASNQFPPLPSPRNQTNQSSLNLTSALNSTTTSWQQVPRPTGRTPFTVATTRTPLSAAS
jgi:hypothetical protein